MAADRVAEKQGEKDVAGEAETPAAQEEEEQEPEDNSKTLDQYLAERAAAALAGDLAKKEARAVSDEVEGKQFQREEPENFFVGKVSNLGDRHLQCSVLIVVGQVREEGEGPQEGEDLHRGRRPVRPARPCSPW